MVAATEELQEGQVRESRFAASFGRGASMLHWAQPAAFLLEATTIEAHLYLTGVPGGNTAQDQSTPKILWHPMMCLSRLFVGHRFSLIVMSADSTRHSPARCSTREGTHSQSGPRSNPWHRGAGRSRSSRKRTPPGRLRFWPRP